MTSERDHVLDAMQVLGVDLSDEKVNEIADELYGGLCGGHVETVEEIARYVVDEVRKAST